MESKKQIKVEEPKQVDVQKLFNDPVLKKQYITQYNEQLKKKNQQSQQPEYLHQKPIPPGEFSKNRTSIGVTGLHSDAIKQQNCEYCKAKRHDQEGLTFQSSGFTSGKIRIDDFERLLSLGYTRTGNYYYARNQTESCCEVYQYKVDITKFHMNSQQRKVMKRFYRYLLYGKQSFIQEKEERKEKPQQNAEPENQYLKDIKQRIISIGQIFNLDVMKIRVYLNKKMECISTNIIKIAMLNAKTGDDTKELELRLTNEFEKLGYLTEFTGDYLNLKKPLSELQTMFPHEFIENKIDKKEQALMNSTKNSFFNNTMTSFRPVNTQNSDDDIQEDLYGQEAMPDEDLHFDKSIFNEKSPNYFTNYVKSTIPINQEERKPKHIYTIEFHRCKYTEELRDLAIKYEKTVHKRETINEDEVKRILADVPTYDPHRLPDALYPALPDKNGIDYFREFKDEGVYPGQGSYHMYHRIDGKLIAVGLFDICNTVANSAYFIYDPDYRFLNIGVVGALIEIDYLRNIRQNFNPKMQYYHLGDLIMNCPKVNYKLNYSPGLILCPYTKKWIPFEVAKPEIEKILALTIDEKKQLDYIRINPDKNIGKPSDLIIEDEMIDLIEFTDVIYMGKRIYKIDQLWKSKDIQTKVISNFISLLENVGFTMFSNFDFEYKQ